MQTIGLIIHVIIISVGSAIHATTTNTNGKDIFSFPISENDPFVITGTRHPQMLKDVPVETSVITSKEIDDANIKTVTEAIRWVPGINISGGAPFGASKRFTAVVSGLPAQYSLILLDGKRIKSEHIHTGVNINLVPISIVEQIEVVRGPASVLYGSDALGGVVNIITKAIPEEAFFNADLSYGRFNTKNASFSHGHKINKFGYVLSGNLVDTDGISGKWYKQQNVSLKTGYEINNNNKIVCNTGYYRNKYLKNNSNIIDDSIDLGLNWKNRSGKDSIFNADTYYVLFEGTGANARNSTSQASLTYNKRLFNINYLTAGAEFRHEEFRRKSTPFTTDNIVAGYLQDELEIIEPLTIIMSFRSDYSDKFKTVLTPKAGLLYKIIPELRIRASAGRGFKAPTLQELYEYHYFHKTYWRDGNPDLKPEYSFSYNASIEYEFDIPVITRISWFRNDFSDMIVVTDTGRIENDGFPIFQRENIKEAYTQGICSETRIRISWLYLLLGYTFMESKDENNKVLAYNPKHLFNIRIYNDFKTIGLNTLLSSEIGLDRYYKTKSGNVEKMNNYTLINLSIEKNILNNFAVYGKAENLLNQKLQIYEEGALAISTGITFNGGIKFNF